MILKSCCFTGYRPSKMPFALNSGTAEYTNFENKLIDAVFSLPDEGCYTFYSGMAMGFDIIAAETVLLLKKAVKNTEIKLICAVPFPEQAEKFSPEWRERYNSILAQADEVITLSQSYHRGCFQKRNEFMVDNSDIVITWFDGQSGGTKNTLIYAKKKDKRIVNLHSLGVHEYLCNSEYIVYEDDD